MRYLFCLGIAIICLTTINLLAKETKKNREEAFYNHPLCPIKLNIGQYTVMIDNLSDQTVIQYQLGCVKKDESFTVISTIMAETRTLEGQHKGKKYHFYLDNVDHGNHPLFDSMKDCQKKKGQFTTLEVVFEGGDKWRLSSIQK